MARKETFMFLLGFLVCTILVYIAFFISEEIPLTSGLINEEELSPVDRIKIQDIIISDEEIIIKVSGASISNYAATGSMKPLIDKGSNGIRIIPKEESEIRIGDLVSYEKDEKTYIHRIIRIGEDEKGKYYITKGDNASLSDEKIRFKDIKYVTIGILW